MDLILASMRLDNPDMPALVRDRTGRADRMAACDRPASLLARALVYSLAAEAGVTSQFRVEKDQRGKPYLLAPNGEIGPSISLTHSASVVVAALCEKGTLGIDIERHKPRDVSALAAVAFGPEERLAVLRYGHDEFYRIWTLREAYAKATGCGLAQAADRIDRFHAGSREGSWMAEIGDSVWRFAAHRIDRAHSLAVALGGVADGCLRTEWISQ